MSPVIVLLLRVKPNIFQVKININKPIIININFLPTQLNDTINKPFIILIIYFITFLDQKLPMLFIMLYTNTLIIIFSVINNYTN